MPRIDMNPEAPSIVEVMEQPTNILDLLRQARSDAHEEPDWAGLYASDYPTPAPINTVSDLDPTEVPPPFLEEEVPANEVSITREELQLLRYSKQVLDALESAGVDNWQGYEIAMDSLEGGPFGNAGD